MFFLLTTLFMNYNYCYLSSCFILCSVCEQAYTMAQNLDPSSAGRGVLQFKTGLMSVIKVDNSIYMEFGCSIWLFSNHVYFLSF